MMETLAVANMQLQIVVIPMTMIPILPVKLVQALRTPTAAPPTPGSLITIVNAAARSFVLT